MHQSQLSLLEYFEYGHLPEGPMRDTSAECCVLANKMAASLELSSAGAELTTGLRKLLEAKDCFVRAAKNL